MKLYSLILFCLAVFIGTGCSKDTEDIAEGLVYYPVFVIDGSELNYVALGSDFTVPSVKVMDGSTDITDKAIIEGDIDLSTPGLYEKTITATTADGYTDSKVIKVFVYHPDYKEADIAGGYVGLRTGKGGGPVTIKQVEKGVYKLSDFLAGYYTTYLERGSSYDADGYLIYIGDKKFMAANINPIFGDMFNTVDLSYDFENGTISYGLELESGYNWGGSKFILTPVVEE